MGKHLLDPDVNILTAAWQTLSVLPFDPFQNWVQVGASLVNATAQGAQPFLGDLGVTPPAVAPNTTPVTIYTLTAAKSAAPVAPTTQDGVTITDPDHIRVGCQGRAERSDDRRRARHQHREGD
ncbi:hypothetical protein [Mycolicibacterium moriokaense]|uniref:hypothetical protein n=1 Tax=Mycolicibacterium moriokaense TaxID=39691 RepID=UPI000D7672F5|nr:hypothetical protein [Mycolicibacterium moriokaense]